MATNVFDQFDQGNVFDQFDTVVPPSSPPKESAMNAFIRGARETPDALYALASGVAGGAAGGLAGLGARAVRGVTGIETNPKQVRESVANIFTHQPTTQTGRDLMRVVGIPGEYISKGAQAIENAATNVNPRLGKVTGETMATVGDLLAAAPLAAGKVKIPERMPSKAEVNAAKAKAQGPAPTPTTQDLRTAASNAYDRAEQAGVAISEGGTGSLKDRIHAVVKDDYDQDLHPHVKAILRRVDETDGALSLSDLEKLRRFAAKQEGAAYRIQGGQDAGRIAGNIVDAIDEFTDGPDMAKFTVTGNSAEGVAALNEARSFYRANRKAQTLDDMVESARDRAGQFSVSGIENALRTEFRQLARSPKRMKQFNADEQMAIKEISRGTGMVNLTRWIGKLAPTGQLSQLIQLGAAASTGGATVPLSLLGFGSRALSGKMQLDKANALSEMIRRGPISQETANMNFKNMALPEPLNLTLADGPLLPTRQPAMLSEFDTSGLGFADDMSLTAPVRQRMTPAEIDAMAGGLQLEKPLLALPNPNKTPMIIDPQGRAAISREQLRDYLQETGQEIMRNVRQPSIETRKLFPLSKKESLEIEAKNLGLFESDSPSLEMRKLEADWMRKYKDATKEK